MDFPDIAAATAAVLLLLQQVLMLNTGLYRAKTGIGVGTGGDLTLERRMRRHGNLAENAAIFVAGLALLELYTGTTPVVMGFAAVFLAARLLHIVGFSTISGSHGPAGPGGPAGRLFVAIRATGATGSALTGIALGGYLLALLAMSGDLPL